MTLLQAIILGIVQGLTEFIPISSTAHLVLAGRVMDLPLSPQQTTASIAVIQLGTLLAVFIYFARDIWSITRAFVGDHLALLSGRKRVLPGGATSVALSREAWLGWLVIIGSIPVGVVGLLFKEEIRGTFTKSLWVIATMMIFVGLLLGIAEMVGKKTRGMDDLGIGDALAIGAAQALSLIPGSSRSGSTIMAGLFAGETRETAARFSFLLSMPAIAASGLLELKEALHSLPQSSLGALAVATAVSAIVGYASIWFLLRFLRTHTTGIFIGYRLILGTVILILLFSGRISPQNEPQSAPVNNPTVSTGPASPGFQSN
ncbi:MAG: undecaprenyl-diphosphatase UppP [Pyrinomonadaceae bacterium]